MGHLQCRRCAWPFHCYFKVTLPCARQCLGAFQVKILCMFCKTLCQQCVHGTAPHQAPCKMTERFRLGMHFQLDSWWPKCQNYHKYVEKNVAASRSYILAETLPKVTVAALVGSCVHTHVLVVYRSYCVTFWRWFSKYLYIYIMANTLVFRAKHELPKATSKQKGS